MFSQAESESVAELLLHMPSSKKAEMVLLKQFVGGSRPLASCERHIRDYLVSCHRFQISDNQFSAYCFLVALSVQNKSAVGLAEQYGLAGKKAIEKHAREALGNILATT